MKLLDRQHFSEFADVIVVQKIHKQSHACFYELILRDTGEERSIGRSIVSVHAQRCRLPVIVLLHLIKNSVENIPLAFKMLIERRRFYADSPGDLGNIDVCIAFFGKQRQRLVQYPFLCIHIRPSSANSD